ncbi:MAG TPA: acyl carrier protein [Solirubrobacteraceae bacterium]|jgi:acyl carrier protein
MSTDTVGASVHQILETVLGAPLASMENPSRDQFDRWDSLTHLEIVFMLEERFDIRFSEEEIVELDSLHGILSTLRDKHVT